MSHSVFAWVDHVERTSCGARVEDGVERGLAEEGDRPHEGRFRELLLELVHDGFAGPFYGRDDLPSNGFFAHDLPLRQKDVTNVT